MSQTTAAREQPTLAEDSLEALRETHRQLEQRLEQLDRHRSLSPEEQFEVQVLKKRKLALKDRMLAKRNGH